MSPIDRLDAFLRARPRLFLALIAAMAVVVVTVLQLSQASRPTLVYQMF